MQYAATSPFRGDARGAFGLAESSLTALGFRLTGRTADSLEMTGPGMSSSREDGLMGATLVTVTGGRGELGITADLGGVAFLSRFVTYFPPALCLFLAAVLSAVFGVLFGPGLWLAAVAAATGGETLLWLLLGPHLARGFRKRTDRALDALLADMVAAGEDPDAGSA